MAAESLLLCEGFLCDVWGLPFVAVCGLSTEVVSLDVVVARGLSCPPGTWNQGLNPHNGVCPLHCKADSLTTGPPEKSLFNVYNKFLFHFSFTFSPWNLSWSAVELPGLSNYLSLIFFFHTSFWKISSTLSSKISMEGLTIVCIYLKDLFFSIIIKSNILPFFHREISLRILTI